MSGAVRVACAGVIHDLPSGPEYERDGNRGDDRVKEGYDVDMELDRKQFQGQFETDQSLISLTAWRSPQHVKPYDDQGALDVFDVVGSKGVPVVESKGRVDVAMTTPFLIFRP